MAIEIKRNSSFANQIEDHKHFRSWVRNLELANKKRYAEIQVETSIGKTHVWCINTHIDTPNTLVIFPGARTTALIWDFDNGLSNLGIPLKIYLVETNGLPNLSDGKTPEIKSLGYGEWAAEVLDQLKIDKAFIAGASFGGLICMKLCIVSPEKVKAAFLLNPGCLQPFSLKLKNLYYNLLPVIIPSERNIRKFLNNAVFHKPDHELSSVSENLLIEYQQLALVHFQDHTQKPYYMDSQLNEVKTDTYLLVGDKDILFPFRKSISNAKERMQHLKEVKVFENVAHGIETHAKALDYIGQVIKSYTSSSHSV